MKDHRTEQNTGSLWRNIGFQHLFWAHVISSVGSGLSSVALGLLAHQLVGASAAAVLGITLTIRIAVIAAGGLLIVRRRLLLAHVVGFLIIENGLFLLGIGVQAQMPWTIELAGLLDLFVLVFLMGIAINQLKSHFPEGESAELTGLQE